MLVALEDKVASVNREAMVLHHKEVMVPHKEVLEEVLVPHKEVSVPHKEVSVPHHKQVASANKDMEPHQEALHQEASVVTNHNIQ